MRVLFLSDSLSDLDGVGRYATRLVAALERQEPGLEARFLLARKHRPTSAQVPARWRVDVALPPDYFYYMSPPRFWASLAQASARAFAAARGVDLVHAIKDYPHSLVAQLAARAARVPCIATAHGTYTVQPLLSRRHGPRARAALLRFDGLISVSAYTKRRILAALPPGALDAERIRVVPNCVDAAHYRERRALGPRPWHAHPFTLAIGELKERKGHHLSLGAFCRIAGRHPELHHYVVGKTSMDDYQRALERTAAAAGLRARVHLLGNVDEDDKVDLLQRARVFVHTPVTAADGGFEGFGLVYLEAAACGTPALGTLDSGAEDAIVPGVTGALVPQALEPVAEALERLLADADLARAMGARARVHAAAQSWDDNARRVLGVYREALA